MPLKPKPSSTLLGKWKETQSAWDDHDFLEVQANAFMKMRWRRLNARAARFCAGFSRELGRGLDLLDVGCGHADFLPWCRASLRSYTGLEPSTALLPRNLSRTEGGVKVGLRRGQAEKMPLPDASADLALVKEVLDHCWGPRQVLEECFRVLRPGGRLLVTLTNDQAWYKRMLPGRARRVKAGQHDHLHYFKPGQVRELALQAGLRAARVDDSHYLRLPGPLESALGRLPDPAGFALIRASDAVGSLLLPEMGGSFWVTAEKA